MGVPSASELQAAARSLAGSSVGTDGFAGDELAALPEPVWQSYAKIVKHWLHLGEVSEAMRHIRQTLIPKGMLVGKDARILSLLKSSGRYQRSAPGR